MIETSHEGFAVLDGDRRFVFASDRAAATVGVAAFAGADLTQVLPELGADDLAAIDSAIASGEPKRFMITRRLGEHRIRAVRLTFVARAAGGSIVMMQDITALRAVQDQRRRTQHRLTEVEDEEQRRIGREIHDGPIQILAALVLRLGAADGHGLGPQDVVELEAAVHAAGTELREIIGRAAPQQGDSAGTLLRRWAAPMIAEAPLVLDVVDLSETPPNRATTEALFVFLHEALRACLGRDTPQTVRAVLAEQDGGHLLDITVPGASDHRIGWDDRREQMRAAGRYAGLLEGWFREEPFGADERRVRAWLPPLEERGWYADELPPTTGARDEPSAVSSVEPDEYPLLSEVDRESVMRASHEGLMELDRELRVVAVNDTYAKAMGRPASSLVGLDFAELFAPDDYARLMPHVDRVRRGIPVRFEWRRRNAIGKQRWMQVAGSPRHDADGRFDGAFMTTLDTTDVHLAEDLRDAVLADLDLARRAARLETARLLSDGPIQRLEDVDDRLLALVETGRPDDVVRLIQRELRRSIAELRTSAEELADPDLSEMAWDEVLRESLSAHLTAAGTVLAIEGPPRLGIPQSKAESIVRIAREAVINAIRHGRAGRVTVKVSEACGELWLVVLDDGTGLGPGSLDPNPGHLGIRSMRERAAELRGALRILPAPGGGTVVVVTIPLVVADIFTT